MSKKIIPVILGALLFLSLSTADPLTRFSVKSLSGKTVTQDVFSDYDITMVNIWATWCGPCVRELPEIQKLYVQIPKNVNIVSFCLDAGDSKKSLKRAQKIVASSNMQFNVLLADKAFGSKLLGAVNSTGIPTTIFVDSKGNIIGKPIIGAPRDVIQFYRTAINDRLNMLKKK